MTQSQKAYICQKARQTKENVSKTTKSPFGVNIPDSELLNNDNSLLTLTIAEIILKSLVSHARYRSD